MRKQLNAIAAKRGNDIGLEKQQFKHVLKIICHQDHQQQIEKQNYEPLTLEQKQLESREIQEQQDKDPQRAEQKEEKNIIEKDSNDSK